MKKAICLCIVVILGGKIALFAQDVNFTKDELTTVLCKKWRLDYVLDNGMKLTPPPGKGFNYEFKQDNTFKLTGSGNGEDGIWTYDPDKSKSSSK